MNPDTIQESKSKPGKLITSISVVYILISVIQTAVQYELIVSLSTGSVSDWDFSVLLFLYPLIVTPVSVILFCCRLKVGWILFAVFLSSVVTGALFMLVVHFATEFLLLTLFYGLTLWIICSEKISAVYSIEQRFVYITVISTFIISVLVMGIFCFS